jgi:hypothetical protein
VYTRRKNVFVDFVEDDASLRCKHGELLHSCTLDGCAEIWALYQESAREKRRELNDRIYAENAKRKRRKSKSEFEIAIEQSGISKRQDYEPKLTEEILETELEPEIPRKLLKNIFADEMTFRVALQYRMLKLSEECLIKAYMASDEEPSDYKRWAAIGKRLGVSGKTVERRFRRLVEKFLTQKPPSGESTHTVKTTHIRGDRQLQYHHRRSIQIGEYRRFSWELITDKKLIQELRRQPPPMIRSNQIAVPLSPVNAMFAAVINRLATDSEREVVLPAGIGESDLEFNVTRAKRVLASKKGLAGPWTRLETAKKLVRGAGLCRACRTFLIRGFRIGGRKITRARQFCDDSCKMKTERRKVRG